MVTRPHAGATTKGPILDPEFAPPFPAAAFPILQDQQLRENVARATDIIQAKRDELVGQKADWEELRAAGSAIRNHTLENLGAYLEQFESQSVHSGRRYRTLGRRCRRRATGHSPIAPSGRRIRGHQDQNNDLS